MNKKYNEEELIKLSPKELVDLGVCPTCLNRKYHGAIYGDDSKTLLYRDNDIEIFFASNPRADGHIIIMSYEHYHDLSEAPIFINHKIIDFSKMLMNEIKVTYGCVRVYLCTMSDGPMNHYHVQLIPRYEYEERGSKNFVKPRKEYIYDEAKFLAIQNKIKEYSKNYK